MSRDGPELDKWDQMELKFGRLLGEDPKLTLAKIMARKANPDVSYLEVEKSFHKNKGKLDESMFNIPADVNVERQSPDDFAKAKNLNLSRPSMRKGVRIAAELNLSRPVMNKGANAARPVERPASFGALQKPLSRTDSDEKHVAPPNVALRKPDVVQEDDIESDKQSKLRLKPNLVLKMREDRDEDLSDMALLKKPEVVQKPPEPDQENVSASRPVMDDPVQLLSPSEMLLDKPKMINAVGPSDCVSDSVAESSKLDGVDIGLQPAEQRGFASDNVEDSSIDEKSLNDGNDVSLQASLMGKPQRLDSSTKEGVRPTGKVTASLNAEGPSSDADIGNLVSAEQEEREANDWKRAEHLLVTGERAEVELISCSGRGFVVSFGSIVGFLPYRNLGAKWKFLAFESWLRKKGLDPSLYRQNLSIIGSYDTPNKSLVVDSDKSQERNETDEETLTPGMKFEDLLEAYDKEKTKFLSSFVGQRIKATVLLADRNSRRLIFSGRPKEKEELVEKKRSLMAKLSVGDVVKCCIKKITYFGIFVEVEGVPALIHQSEVSWDATLDPSSYYKIGQIVEAKVHQLDYALERITLSLKEITPDPLMEALESVVGDRTSLGFNLEAAQADIEPWADVESLIEELQQIDEVQSVSKGRFFLSPGLAPTFQVYMASMFDNQYKLLARYGNKVQEVLVQSSLDKEQMKSAILTCTNRVQ